VSGLGGRVAGRELVLASAGSGKTYQLSSRLIGLLAAGAPPEEILASTFTRKAAGEILERVLLRLARGAVSPDAAAELARSIPDGAPRDRLTPEGCGELLARTVGSLHRLHVHTLDAFFHGMARAFSLELGLPGEWSVADEPMEARLRNRALEDALREGDDGSMVELVRMAGRGDADRSVHALLLEQVVALDALRHEMASGGEERWGGPLEAGDASAPSAEEIEAAAAWLEGMELPVTKSGTPRRHWKTNVDRIVVAARARDWDALFDTSLVQRVVHDDLRFDHADVGPEVREPIRTLLRAAVAELRPLLRRRVRALGRFLPEFDDRLRRLQRQEGAYGFGDVARALLPGAATRDLDQLHYRLDGRIRHVLLDEFQDTSTLQWAALEPLVGEILSGYDGERAAFIVADPKQSIYGWRDGEPRILDRIRERYGLEPSTLARSWRSSPVVLDMVNRVFDRIWTNPVVADDEAVREISVRWGASFERHEAARPDLPGHASLETGPDGKDGTGPSVSGSPLLHHTARRVAELHRRLPGASIGILTRRNVTVAGLIAELRELGVEASEEGGVPVADAPAVVAVLSLLKVLDHPGDRISRYLVARSPLGPVVGLEDWRFEVQAEEVARTLRARLLREGYGAVFADWARRVHPHLTPRERRRLRATVELAHRWEDRATLRPGEFVRMAESARVEDAGSGGGVRIMTVHRSKGLEFDVVVLPELDRLSLAPGGLPPFLAERDDDGAGPVRRILAGVPTDREPLFPELATAARQHRESAVRDGLSSLYVGLTRARFAVHAIVRPDPNGSSRARTGARLLRRALAPDEPAVAETVLWSLGDADWWEHEEARKHLGSTAAGPPPGLPAGPSPTLAFAGTPRRRHLQRRSPSDLEGGERIPLSTLLRPFPPDAMARGTLVHAWLEELEWLEVGGPERARCLEIARERAPAYEGAERLFQAWLRWIQEPPIRALLSRDAFPSGTRVERELAFMTRYRDGVLRGVADRVVRVPGADGPRFLVVDWKTDRISAGDGDELDRRAAFYRPQIEAYCDALARLEGVDPDRVDGVLAFLEPGIVRRVPGADRPAR
jgi:ATP-dependent helicase/nuclease subunit A